MIVIVVIIVMNKLQLAVYPPTAGGPPFPAANVETHYENRIALETVLMAYLDIKRKNIAATARMVPGRSTKKMVGYWPFHQFLARA